MFHSAIALNVLLFDKAVCNIKVNCMTVLQMYYYQIDLVRKPVEITCIESIYNFKIISS